MAEFSSLDRRWKVSTSPTHVYFVGGPFSQWFKCSFKGKLPISEDAPWDDPRILDEANWQGTNWLGQCLMDVRAKAYESLLKDIHPGHQR